jgi:hypothetical protein
MRIESLVLPQAGMTESAALDLRSRSRHGGQIARSWEGGTSRRLRKKVEMLFAHLKRILKLDRLPLRGPNGARRVHPRGNRPEPSKDGQADPDVHPEARIGRKTSSASSRRSYYNEIPQPFFNAIERRADGAMQESKQPRAAKLLPPLSPGSSGLFWNAS